MQSLLQLSDGGWRKVPSTLKLTQFSWYSNWRKKPLAIQVRGWARSQLPHPWLYNAKWKRKCGPWTYMYVARDFCMTQEDHMYTQTGKVMRFLYCCHLFSVFFFHRCKTTTTTTIQNIHNNNNNKNLHHSNSALYCLFSSQLIMLVLFPLKLVLKSWQKMLLNHWRCVKTPCKLYSLVEYSELYFSNPA